MPLTFVTEVYEEYRPVQTDVSPEDAQRMLKARLLDRLEDTIEGGSVTSVEYDVAEDGESVTVILRAECLEEIGAQFPPEADGEDTGGE